MGSRLQHKDQSGFTIVELMIATAVFSMVLLVCAFAIMHVGRMYYKGTIVNRTQEASRRIIDDVAIAIQFGESEGLSDNYYESVTADFGGIDIEARCFGEVRYSFVRDRAKTASSGLEAILVKDMYPFDACVPLDLTNTSLFSDPASVGALDPVELLSTNMRIPHFEADKDESSGVWTISIRIAYGDDPTLFEGDGLEANPSDGYKFCKGPNAGGQFCAVSDITTQVIKRI